MHGRASISINLSVSDDYKLLQDQIEISDYVSLVIKNVLELIYMEFSQIYMTMILNLFYIDHLREEFKSCSFDHSIKSPYAFYTVYNKEQNKPYN